MEKDMTQTIEEAVLEAIEFNHSKDDLIQIILKVLNADTDPNSQIITLRNILNDLYNQEMSNKEP